MSSKRGSNVPKTSKKTKSKNDNEIYYKKGRKKIFDDSDDNVEEFQNSEDEYVSQSGGESDGESTENELGDDSSNLDIDPDDEMDPIEDDKYDPVNENEELEDPSEETDPEEEEAAASAEEAETEAIEDEIEVDEVIAAEETAEVAEGYAVEAKTCHMKNLNKDFFVLDEDDSNMYGKMEYKRIADNDRESDPTMTYYEMVRIIGTRAQQFNFGAEPLVKGLDGIHPAKMAYVELIAKMTPYIIRRHLPGKRYEEWRIDELEIIHVITDDFFVPENFDWDALMKQANEYNSTYQTKLIPKQKTTKRISRTTQSRIKGSKTKSKISKSKKIIQK
jgi:DNA-directed RNA polymerase subunit K/omega